MDGYIKIHRKIMDTSIYFNSQAVHLFLHLLLKASYKDRDVMFNNKIVKLKAGQFITGRKKLAEETSISESKIYRLLDIFENENLIEQQPNSRYSIISIKNWSEYQEVEQQVNSNRTASEQQVNTNNKDKKDNKDKKVNILGEFKNIFLSNDELEKVKEIYENNLDEAIEILSSYIEYKNKKYKSHYAVLGKHNWVYKRINENNKVTTIEDGYSL